VRAFTAFIKNDGAGTETLGNYKFMISKWDNSKEPWKKGVLKNFPRKKLGGWDLLFRCLRVAAEYGNRR
jgi:hypothetical protein